MNILIIEDEPTAARKLTDMLHKTDSNFSIVAVIESVEEAIAWFNSNPAPDLAFVDVQLADDVSFEIFEHVDINIPLIFTTAYDQYVLEALEHNSIDYLVKPLREDRLQKALEKVKKLETHFLRFKFNQLFDRSQEDKSRKRLLVKRGIDYVSVPVKKVAWFFTEHKIVFLLDKEGEKYIIDKTISELEAELDHNLFFRANRKYLVHIDAIQKFKPDNGKLALQLQPPASEDVHVSKENAPNFRTWIER